MSVPFGFFGRAIIKLTDILLSNTTITTGDTTVGTISAVGGNPPVTFTLV